jgi:hypothetical protein
MFSDDHVKQWYYTKNLKKSQILVIISEKMRIFSENISPFIFIFCIFGEILNPKKSWLMLSENFDYN